MIRILHAADIHLDSPFQSLTAQQALTRRAEQRELLGRIAALAVEREADMLVFSGDLFDSDALFSETGRSVERALAGLSIPVFFAPGNHDWYSANSPWDDLQLGDNVHIFRSEDMECVPLPRLGARVWGTAFCSRSRRAFLADFHAEKTDGMVDIMVAHGEVGTPDSSYGPISIEQLENSGMDYVALGHNHSYSGLRCAGNTFYAWPGCPEGRGFDECGEKGVILAELEQGSCHAEFIPLDGRKYEILKVDITEKDDPQQTALEALAGRGKGDVYRIIFTGQTDTPPDLTALRRSLESRFYALQLRDETSPRRELWEGCGENSLRGIFLAKMRSRYDEADDKEKQKIVRAVRWGLQALDNGEEFPI